MRKKTGKIIFSTSCIAILLFTFVIPTHETKDNGEWAKKYKGMGYAIAQDIKKAKDGGFIICGMTVTPSDALGIWDAWLLRVDEEGNKLWEKFFGEKGEDVFNSVCVTEDGYVIAGYTTSGIYADNEDVWLVKVDKEGEKLWEKTYGMVWYNEKAEKVIETRDGGYIMVGVSYGHGKEDDVLVIKTDKDGNVEWKKFFGGSKPDWGDNIIEIEDGYLISGISDSYSLYGDWDTWLIKIDENGNEIWNKTYGWWNCEWNAFVRKIDNGYAIAGYTISGPYGNEEAYAYLIITDKEGNEIWKKRYGGWWDAEEIHDFEVTKDGYILCGGTESYGVGDFDAWLLKVDKEGNEIWNKSFGKRGADWANAVIPLNDGYIFVGSTETQIGHIYFQLSAWLVKCNDEQPPKIKIVRPKENYLYISDREIMPFNRTLVIGKITVIAESNNPDRINRVEFYYTSQIIYDWIPRKIDYFPPYKWRCGVFGLNTWGRITCAARYGNAGDVAVDKIEVYIINPLPSPLYKAINNREYY